MQQLTKFDDCKPISILISHDNALNAKVDHGDLLFAGYILRIQAASTDI